MKFQTQWSRDESARYEKVDIDQESLTVPGQALTAQQVISRFQRGLPIEGVRVPEYNGDDYPLAGIEKLDISEVHDLYHEATERVEYLRQEMNKKEREKREAEQKEFIEWQKAKIEAAKKAAEEKEQPNE